MESVVQIANDVLCECGNKHMNFSTGIYSLIYNTVSCVGTSISSEILGCLLLGRMRSHYLCKATHIIEA